METTTTRETLTEALATAAATTSDAWSMLAWGIENQLSSAGFHHEAAAVASCRTRAEFTETCSTYAAELFR